MAREKKMRRIRLVGITAGMLILSSAQAEDQAKISREGSVLLERCLSSDLAYRGSLSAANDCYSAEIYRRGLVLSNLFRRSARSRTSRSSARMQQNWRERLELNCRQTARRETGQAAGEASLDALDTRFLTSSCVLAGINRRIQILSRGASH
jgi:hypothetical protein